MSFEASLIKTNSKTPQKPLLVPRGCREKGEEIELQQKEVMDRKKHFGGKKKGNNGQNKTVEEKEEKSIG